MVKWTSYADAGSWADADILWTVIDPLGTPLDRTLHRDDVLRREHAQISIADGTDTQSLLTASGFTVTTAWAADGVDGAAAYVFTPDSANNRVTIVPISDGVVVAWNVAFAGVSGVKYDFAVFYNGAEVAGGRDQVTVPLGSEVLRAGAQTIIPAAGASQHVDLRAKVDADATFDIKQATLSLYRLA